MQALLPIDRGIRCVDARLDHLSAHGSLSDKPSTEYCKRSIHAALVLCPSVIGFHILHIILLLARTGTFSDMGIESLEQSTRRQSGIELGISNKKDAARREAPPNSYGCVKFGSDTARHTNTELGTMVLFVWLFNQQNIVCCVWLDRSQVIKKWY